MSRASSKAGRSGDRGRPEDDVDRVAAEGDRWARDPTAAHADAVGAARREPNGERTAAECAAGGQLDLSGVAVLFDDEFFHLEHLMQRSPRARAGGRASLLVGDRTVSG